LVLKMNPGGSSDAQVTETYQIDTEYVNVRSLRQNLGMSQREFASAFGLALTSVRNWEQGRSEPDASIQSYLAVIKNEPEMVIRALAKMRSELAVDRIQ
jgi:DNA-binding transcriptional regulator YiaG